MLSKRRSEKILRTSWLLLHEFANIDTWISLLLYVDFSKLQHGQKNKLKFDQDFKACWSFCFEQKVLNESKNSKPWVRCAFGNVFFYLKMKMMQCLSDWAPAQGIRTIRGANIPTNPYNLPHTLIIFKIYFFCFVFSLQISILSKIFCLSRIFRVLVWFNMTLKFFWIVDFKIICWGDSSQCSKTKPRAMSDLQLSGLKQRFLKWSNFVFLDALASLKTMFKIKWLIK